MRTLSRLGMAGRLVVAAVAIAAAGAAPVRAAEAASPSGDPGPGLVLLVAGFLALLAALSRPEPDAPPDARKRP